MKRAWIVGIIVVVAISAIIIWNVNQEDLNVNEESEANVLITTNNATQIQSNSELVIWSFNSSQWTPSRTPPACPEPLVFDMPVDIDLVTSVLYPGQFRPDYKPHGGFRFDTSSSNAISVYAPLEGYVFKGARYLASGELQYVFFIVHPCGIMYRLGHLKKVSPKLENLAEKFPEPKELDSRDYITEHVQVEKGELLATEVGVTGNYFFDWGVYDLRNKNDASKDQEWLAEHSNDQAPYSICWLDFLASEESIKIKSLPGADGISGKESDYCD